MLVKGATGQTYIGDYLKCTKLWISFNVFWAFVISENSHHFPESSSCPLHNANSVKCHYNAVQFITILHMALPLPWQEVNQISLSQQTPNILPSQASYGVSIVRIEEKFDRVIMAPRCIYKLGLSLKTMEQSRRHMDSRVTWLRAVCILSISLMEDEMCETQSLYMSRGEEYSLVSFPN